MRRHRLIARLALAVAAALVLVVAPATGATKKKHSVDLSVRAARVATSGDSNTVAGTFTGPPYGKGAVVYVTTPAANNALAAKYTGYTAKGTVRGTTLVTPTPQPDGTTSFAGTLQVTGGTGRYRGARGKDLKVTGRFDPRENVFTFEITGTVRY